MTADGARRPPSPSSPAVSRRMHPSEPARRPPSRAVGQPLITFHEALYTSGPQGVSRPSAHQFGSAAVRGRTAPHSSSVLNYFYCQRSNVQLPSRSLNSAARCGKRPRSRCRRPEHGPGCNLQPTKPRYFRVHSQPEMVYYPIAVKRELRIDHDSPRASATSNISRRIALL
jgi:hypothetical protein